MDDIYKLITNQFDYLKSLGLVFEYKETNGKLGDRILKTFSYDNIDKKRKIEIVYCIVENYQHLYGFLINYNLEEQISTNQKNNISFDRLRCFFDEGEDIIFFGNEQYDLAYKLKEFKLIIEKFIPYITSNSWINYDELLVQIKKIYSQTLETSNYYDWAVQIKADYFIKKSLIVIFDSSKEPIYETFGLRLKSNIGIQFHITHGYKSRDDDGFTIEVIYPDNRTEIHEFINISSDKVIQFITEKVST